MRSTPQKLLLGLLVAFVLFLIVKRQKKTETNHRTPPINQNWMGSKYLPLIPYIEAQARHETGNYSSRLAKEQFNLFGMNSPSKRPFVGVKNAGSFMTYKDYRQSVEDLLLWMDYTKFPTSVSGSLQYVTELKKRNYFEDTIQNYLKGINSALSALRVDGIQGFNITSF